MKTSKLPIRVTASLYGMRSKGKYGSILATAGHKPVREMAQFGRWEGHEMGFYLNGDVIGGGELKRIRYLSGKKKTCLQTEGVALNKPFRKKGHGIHLYLHLIAHAKACGAERIYSSRNLNKHSRRMWSQKLAKLFTVVPVAHRKPCSECGCKCKTRPPLGYYIRFKGK